MADNSERKHWVEPAIQVLEIEETFAQPQAGADVGGNPFPDCQRS